MEVASDFHRPNYQASEPHQQLLKGDLWYPQEFQTQWYMVIVSDIIMFAESKNPNFNPGVGNCPILGILNITL